MKLVNEQRIGLSTAVFLAHDDYDYDSRPNSVSTTKLLDSTRQLILSKRAGALAVAADKDVDISTFVASRFGSAMHDGIERAWTGGRYKKALYKLGYTKKTIDRIVVNPGYMENDKGQLVKDPNAKPMAADAIPIYMEIRTEKAVGKFILSGKFDFIGDGELEDHKTTGVFGYMKNGGANEKFRQQLSIYRWLNPDLITSDRGLINYTFTDWSKLRSMIESKKGYPPFRMMSVPVTLMSVDETQKFIEGKLREVDACIRLDESQLPLCSKEDLWQDDAKYAYYKNPEKKARSTANFDTFAEAQLRMLKDGNVGVIDIRYAEAKRCAYCAGAPICSQARQLAADGLLNLEA